MKRKVVFIDSHPASAETFRHWSAVGTLEIETIHPGEFSVGQLAPDVDLVVIDVSSPQGLLAFGALKKAKALSHLRVVTLVSREAMYDTDISLDSGAVGAIPLPIDERAAGKIMTFLLSQ